MESAPQPAPADEIVHEDIKGLIEKPEFQALGREGRRSVMVAADPRFRALDRASQDYVLGQTETLSATPSRAQGLIQGIKNDPAMAAGLAGGALAAGLGAGPLASAGIAALSGGGAEMARQQMLPEGAPDKPATTGQAVLNSVVEGGKQGLLDATGSTVMGLASKALAPVLGGLAKSVTPEGGRALEYIAPYVEPPRSVIGRVFGKLGMRPEGVLPAQATHSAAIDTLQGIAEASYFGRETLRNFRMGRQAEAARAALADLVAHFGQNADPTAVADVFREAINHRLDVSQLMRGSLYGTLRTMIDPTALTVDLSAIRMNPAVRRLAESAATAAGIENEASGATIAQRVMELPQMVSFEDAQALRSRLLTAQRNIDPERANAFRGKVGITKQMIGEVDRAVEQSLVSNPEALGLWRKANALTRRDEATLNNDVVRGLLKIADPANAAATGRAGRPELLADALFSAGNATGIRRVKEAVGGEGTPAFRDLQGLFLQRWLQKGTPRGGQQLEEAAGGLLSAPAEAGDLSGTALKEALTGRTGLGEAGLKELFADPEIRNGLKDFASFLTVSQQKNPSRGTLLVPLAQASGIAGIIASIGASNAGYERQAKYGLAGSTMLVLAPEMLARMLLNPYTSRLLTRAMRTEPTSRAAGVLANKLLVAKAFMDAGQEPGGTAVPGAAGGAFVEGRQGGGPVMAGMPYMVGEGGPELMVPSQSGTVVPMTTPLSNEGGGPSNMPVTLDPNTAPMGTGAQATPGTGRQPGKTDVPPTTPVHVPQVAPIAASEIPSIPQPAPQQGSPLAELVMALLAQGKPQRARQ